MTFRLCLLRGALGCALAVSATTVAAFAGDPCGLCAKEVVMNSDLASCFLEQYDEFAKSTGQAVAVDLSTCASRGIVEALPAPDAAVQEPDTQFLISRDQLTCLKKKLEQPGLVLDPSAKIELGSC